MAKISPFRAIRPPRDKAYLVSSKPFYSYKKHILEAKMEHNPYTFLHVINPEFGEARDTESNTVERFKYVRQKYDQFMAEGTFIQDVEECFYIYRQRTEDHTFFGFIAGASVDDYVNGHIKVHEQTLTQREDMFKMYLDVCGFNAEPVLLTYKSNDVINGILNKHINERSEYEFATTDRIKHDLWKVNNPEDMQIIMDEFDKINDIYIADGHHRTSSSVLFAQSKRKESPELANRRSLNSFLAFFIPETNLRIYEFNRTVNTLNDLTPDEFIIKLKDSFEIEHKGKDVYKPTNRHNIAMYIDDSWYSMTLKEGICDENDPVDKLDTRVLTKNVLDPILGIKDLKTDDRVDFIEGTRGLEALQTAVDTSRAKIAFALYPISVEELKDVADNNQIMPPKSTWIEPKMRSGLTIFSLEH